MDCFFNPTHAGIVSNYNARGFTGSIECGDAIELTMYINEEAKFRSNGAVRFSISKYTSKEDIDYVAKRLSEIVTRLREISPFKDR